jgi:hypothetical protein
MHAYDPAYVQAQRHLGSLAETVILVRSVIYLPPNDEFVDLATDLAAAPPAPSMSGELTVEVAAELVRAGVLGLATHTIPQLRRFLPKFERVITARFVVPFGYQLILASEGHTAELLALMPGQWRADWTFHAWGADEELHIQFPPSYVQAGSATATLSSRDGHRSWRYATNGYQAEWLHLADVAEGRPSSPSPSRPPSRTCCSPWSWPTAPPSRSGSRHEHDPVRQAARRRPSSR